MLLSEDSSSTTTSKDLPFFTLVRKGYEPMDYFVKKGETILTYKILDDHDAVVEPSSDMELYVAGYSAGSQDYYYHFTVCDEDGTSGCQDGKMYIDESEVKFKYINKKCTPLDKLSFQVTRFSSETDEEDAKFITTALCMYVRRELRYLTDDDLHTAMDAMYTVYSTDEEEGAKKYGKTFHNSTYFLNAHHFNAAWRDSDHIHEGLGFLPQHIKITNMFEEALQAVEPSTSLPYWDFTIDTETSKWPQDSFAFTPDTFGTIIPAVDAAWGYTYRNDSIKNGRIPDGRWKHLKADMNWKFAGWDELDANYGYLRAPWNANPSPYVSRFSGYTTGLPSCTNHYKWLEYTAMTDFLTVSPFAPHASVHGAVGAVFGCDLMDPLREQGLFVSATQQNNFCQKWSFLIKELYRKNFLSGAATGDCSYKKLTSSGQTCNFVCNEDKYEHMGSQLSLLIAAEYTGTLTQDQYNVFRDFICTGDGAKIFAGDHLESASPADPSFWPVHPTLERLVQAKYLAGGFPDTTWPSDSVNEYVCDKAQCYNEEGVQGYYASCCYGHYENDQLLDFITPDKNSGTGPTNAAIWKGTDPRADDYSMTYLYSDFDWSHCDQDFSYLIEQLSSTSGEDRAEGVYSSIDTIYDTIWSWLTGSSTDVRRR